MTDPKIDDGAKDGAVGDDQAETKNKVGRPKKVSGFDPEQEYSTIHGSENGAAFQQDGKFYTNDGREVSAP